MSGASAQPRYRAVPRRHPSRTQPPAQKRNPRVDPQPGDELVVTRRRRVVEVDSPGCAGRRRVRYVCPATGAEGEVLLSSWRRWAEKAQVLA